MSHAGPTPLRRRYLTRLLGYTAPPSGDELGYARVVLARLRALHRPFGIYDECDCKRDTETGETVHHDGQEVIDCGDFETCQPPMWFVCAHCCRDVAGEYLTLECTEHHIHGPGTPHCQTAAILGGAR